MTDQALHSKAFNQAIAEDLLIGSHCLVCGKSQSLSGKSALTAIPIRWNAFRQTE